jgi:hypothetical protein
MANTVQSIGSFTGTISHPLVNGGALLTIRGLKLDSTFLQATPDMDNSKRIALVGGGPGAVDTAALTTSVTMGTLNLNVIRVAGSVSADLIRFCLAWQKTADSTGASVNISYNINGTTETWAFLACTLLKVPPLQLAGNDLPEYSVTLSYGDYNVS